MYRGLRLARLDLGHQRHRLADGDQLGVESFGVLQGKRTSMCGIESATRGTLARIGDTLGGNWKMTCAPNSKAV